MSELNSQITRLKITYLAKLPLFISLKSLCRYSSKAVSLLMRRTQEMGKQENNAHNVVRIKASDLLSRVPRFPLHSFSQGWCVGEEVGGWHPRCQRKKNIYMGGEASSLAGDFLRKEEGNFYLAPLLLPFFITAEHDRAFFAWAPMQQFYIPFSFCRITLEGYFKPPVVRQQLVLRASSLSPAWHTLRSRVWSFHLPAAKWMPVIVTVCWINWEGSICWLRTNSKTHPLSH